MIHQLFSNANPTDNFSNKIGFYDFKLFENLDEMVEQIKLKEKQMGLSRLVAGFAWEWISKNDSNLYDIQIESTQLKWNSITK